MKFKIKALLVLMMIGLCQSSLAENRPQTLWLGFFNSDYALLQLSCTILKFKPMTFHFYGTNNLPATLSQKLEEYKEQFALDIQQAGFNAVVDYRENWLGGSGGLEYSEFGMTTRNVLISGVGTLSGTALKLDCK